MINGKERVNKVLNFEETRPVPYYLMRRPEVEAKLREHLGVEDIDAAMGSSLHLFSVPFMVDHEIGDLRPKEVFRDAFGVGYEWTERGGMCPLYYPLQEASSLEDLQVPAVRLDHEEIKRRIEAHADEFVLAIKYCGLFERAWFLRGMENLCVDFYQAPGFVEDMLDRLVEFNLAVIRELVQFNIDGIMLGDDWGSQVGLIMGPQIWRKFIKPRAARLYEEIRAAGLPVFVHSCGNIIEIIPDLIEIGVNALNPIQVIAMDPEEIKHKYGDRLTMFGGVSTQQTFPYGNPEDVKEETRLRIEVLGAGGGYILAPDQELQMDVPMENIMAFVEAARSQ
jgi:uroporphyrinogen decarboxylase